MLSENCSNVNGTKPQVRWYKAMFICEKCLAVNPTRWAPANLTYGDLSDTACWTRTQLDNKSYYEVPNTTPSPWTAVRGFDINTVFEDLLHNVHLGIGRDLVGSVLIELAVSFQASFGLDTLDEALRMIYADFVTWSKARGLRSSRRRFTLKLLGRSETNRKTYPVVGTQVKAASMKVIIAYLAHKTQSMPANNHYERVRATCLWAIADFMHVCDTSDFWMTKAESDRAVYAGNSFLRCYQFLAAENLARREPLYKVRPKVHYFKHTVMDIRRSRMNPNFFHCFMSEDFVGRHARLASKTHRSSVSIRTLQRYMLVLRGLWAPQSKAKL